MPPYCERHRTYHDGPRECWQQDERERAESRDRMRREKAERIAWQVVDAEQRAAIERDGGDALWTIRLATAAAYAALTEKESA